MLLAIFALTCQMSLFVTDGNSMDVMTEPKFCENLKNLVDSRPDPTYLVVPEAAFTGTVTMIICHNPGDKE